jgi:hypothetical protein
MAGIVAALAVPAAATAGDGAADAAAKAQRGGQLNIKFVLNSRDGEPVALKRFRFENLRATCADDIVNVSGKIRTIPVNDRNRFRKTVRRNGKLVKVRGRVSNDLDRVRGTIRARGDFAGAENCDSSRVHWSAS